MARFDRLIERVPAAQTSQLGLMETEFEAAKLLKRIGVERFDCIELMSGMACRYADSHFRKPSPSQLSAPVNLLFTNPVVQSQSQFNAASVNDLLSEKCANALLTLVKWLRNEPGIIKSIYSASLRSNETNKVTQSLQKLGSFKNMLTTYKFNFIKDPGLGLDSSEIFLSDLHDLATVLSPKQAKTWLELANWCYKCGKKNADRLQQALSGNEDSGLFKQFPLHATKIEKDQVLSILSSRLGLVNMGSVGGLRECGLSCKDKEGFLVETRQMIIEGCKSLTVECVDEIVEIWMKVVNRIYYFHRIACKAYFTYLSLSDQVNFNMIK